jgi:hypothetical protein
MSNNLANIEVTCATKNAAGMKGFMYIIKKEDVTTVPAATGHAITGDITLEATKVWFRWTISKERAKNTWTITSEGDKDASTDNVVFAAVIAGIDKTKSAILEINPACEFLVIVEDKNGKRRLLGDLSEGCTVKVGETVNETANQYDIEVMWDGGYKPYFYEGVITT